MFFFEQRKSIFAKYFLFGGSDNQEDDEADDGRSAGASFSQHWGWWGTIYSLSKSNILQITGDRSITDVNLMTALNYLEIDKDYNNEIQKLEKQALQQNRVR